MLDFCIMQINKMAAAKMRRIYGGFDNLSKHDLNQILMKFNNKNKSLSNLMGQRFLYHWVLLIKSWPFMTAYYLLSEHHFDYE